MNPIYKFELTANGTTQRAFPIYKDDLAKDFEKESGQEFFRAKLSGNLTFESDDYTFIVSKAFDTQFVLEIFISYNAGQTWTSYWRGTFWKTDCEFDGDEQTVKVKPTVLDQYNDVLAGMDKEYNIIDLSPEITPVKADKRPMIQVYVPGQQVIGCFLSGMWWEQECESVLESDMVEIEGHNYRALEYKYHFSLNKEMVIALVSGTMSPQLPEMFTANYVGDTRFDPSTPGQYDFVCGDYTLRYFFFVGSGGATQTLQIFRTDTPNTILWSYAYSGGTLPDTSLPMTKVLTPVSGSGATGNVTLNISTIPVYSRYVLDTAQLSGLDTYEIPSDDIVENNRNYHRVIGYYFPDTIYFSTLLTATPNQWGLYQPGQYYKQPYLYWNPELFPIARNGWGRVSIWFTFSSFDWIVEESAREPFTIRHAYPLASVLSVLLGKIAPGITHAANTDYSQFLYGTNLIGITQTLMITPKSNIVSAGYDQPAQKAPITLKNVLDMLRDCFRCYWFIDSNNRFRVEHIQYFRNGGSYSGSPVVGVDLTAQKVTRNGKAWAFGRDQFKFDKPEMAARYQFGWMDDVTQLFDGFPIDIISKYVNPDNIEQIDISKFTSDIDYILLNPGEISKDGFVLMAAQPNNDLGNSESYPMATSVTFRNPVPADWKGKTATIKYSLTGGRFLVRVFAGGAATDTPYMTGNGTVSFNIPQNASGIYFVGGTSGETLTIAWLNFGEMTLPYINFNYDGTDHILQNAYAAFVFLQNYYAYDMPASQYAINGVQMYAQGVKRLKTQSLKFPMLTDPDVLRLVKTNLGNGMIQKLSVNLSSRNANATLKYDTE